MKKKEKRLPYNNWEHLKVTEMIATGENLKNKFVLILMLMVFSKTWSHEKTSVNNSGLQHLEKFNGTKNCSNDSKSKKNTWLEINSKDDYIDIRTVDGTGNDGWRLAGYNLVSIDCSKNSITVQDRNSKTLSIVQMMSGDMVNYVGLNNACDTEAIQIGENLMNLNEQGVTIFEKLNDPSSKTVAIIQPKELAKVVEKTTVDGTEEWLRVSKNGILGWVNGDLLNHIPAGDCFSKPVTPENFSASLKDVGTARKTCTFIGQRSNDLELKYLDKLILNTNNQKIEFNQSVFSACFASLMRQSKKHGIHTNALPYFVNLFKDASAKKTAYSIIEKYCKETVMNYDVSSYKADDFYYCREDFLAKFLFSPTELNHIQELLHNSTVYKSIAECERKEIGFKVPFESDNLALVTVLPDKKMKILKIIKGYGDYSVNDTVEIDWTGEGILTRKGPPAKNEFIIPFYKKLGETFVKYDECILENTELNVKEWLSNSRKDHLVPFSKKSCVADIDAIQPWYEIYSKKENGLTIRIKLENGKIIEKNYGSRYEEECEYDCGYTVLKLKKINCKKKTIEFDGIEGKLILSLIDGNGVI